MRLDPWKLAALVLFVACVDEVARPDVAHAPGSSLEQLERSDNVESVPSSALDPAAPSASELDEDRADPAAEHDSDDERESLSEPSAQD